jgi:hypothetical protein
MIKATGKGVLCVAAYVALIVTFLPRVAFSQTEGTEARTFTIRQSIQGSSSSFGQILKLNTNIGYQRGRHFGGDIGLPFYLVDYSNVDITTTASAHQAGIGNAYADFWLAFGGPLNYTSTVTVTAPTGDRSKGLSTGHATVDWNNGFRHVIAHRVAPYANIGVANTVSDTPFFLRPFSSNGIVGHFEAGTTLSISRQVYVGGSGYGIVPSGEQTIVSKVVETHTEIVPGTGRSLPPNAKGKGLGLNKPTTRVFETTTEVVGTADLTSDHGFSTWVGVGPVRQFDFTVGYSRSQRYALDTVFWGIGFRFPSFGPRVR